MRVKRHWFKDGKERGAAELASAMAAIVWRSADHALNNLRAARYEIEAGLPYVSFLKEFLVFLTVITDRIAYRHDAGTWRTEFTSALVNRVGEIYQENFDRLLGPLPEDGHKAQLLALFNDRAAEYADFSYDESGPEFGFIRYFANNITEVLSDPVDRRWSLDQIMTVQAPEAVALIERGMAGVLGIEPKPTRRGGSSGD
jgi:hypothetical protein